MSLARVRMLALAVVVTGCAPHARQAPHPRAVERLLLARLTDGPPLQVADPRGPAPGFIIWHRYDGPGRLPALYVVDGVPLSRKGFLATHLQRVDIVKVWILKGPDAVARYGLRTGEDLVLVFRTRRR